VGRKDVIEAMNQFKIVFAEHYHRHKYYIGMQFRYNQQIINQCKAIGCHWSRSLSSWLIENTAHNYQQILNSFGESYDLDLKALQQAYRERVSGRIRNRLFSEQIEGDATELGQQYLDKFYEMMLTRRYSVNTISTYVNLLKSFFNYFKDEDPKSLGPDHYAEFTREFIYRGGYSTTYQRQLSASLRLFYSKCIRVSWDTNSIVIPQKVRKLPVVLSRDEVRAYLESSPNLKTRCFLSMLYSCGLRMGEMLNMKWTDIDRERRMIWIRSAKGKKDRRVPLSRNLEQLLTRYFLV